MAQVVIWNTMVQPHDIYSYVNRPSGGWAIKKWLELNGYSVQVIDFCNTMDHQTLEELTLAHIDDSTLVLGMGITFFESYIPPWAKNISKLALAKNPKLKLVAGGFSFYLPWHERDSGWLFLPDHGEDKLLKLLDEMSGKDYSKRSLFNIKTCQNKYTDDFIPYEGEVLDLEMSRGCQFKCKFCRYPLLGKAKGSYIRDIELVRDEIISNYERFGTTRYRIICDTFNESGDKAEQLWKVTQGLPFKFEWTGFLRMDLLYRNPESLDMLEESGLRGTFFGIESMRSRGAKAIGKGWNSTIQCMDYMLYLNERYKQNKNRMTIAMIAGVPGDTLQSVTEDAKFLTDNKFESIVWNPLSIIPKIHEIQYATPSTFDFEYADHGYVFPDLDTHEDTDNFLEAAMKRVSWVSDTWNFMDAYKFAKDETIKTANRPESRIQSWNVFDYASAMNISVDEAMDVQTMKTNEWRPAYQDRAIKLANEYAEKLRKRL